MGSPLIRLSFKRGLLTAGIAAGFSVLFLILGLYDSIYSFRFKTDLLIHYTAILVFVIITIRTFKKANNHYLKLSEAIKIGIFLALIAALGYILYSFIFINVLKPDYNTNYYYGTYSEQSWEHYYEINPEEHTRESYDIHAEGALQREYQFVYPFLLVISLFIGFITSLIGGLIMKKKPKRDH
jgi:H+/Cl- antiporter ClcA